MRQAGREQEGAALAGRLRECRAEIEQATLTRVYAVSEPPGGPEYVEGLRNAVSAGLDYGLEGIERGEQSAPPVPEALLAQARLAARSGVNLDTVLRRYFAGYTILSDYLFEAEGGLIDDTALKPLLRSQAVLFDRLLAAVSEEYTREVSSRHKTAEQRRAERVQRLLAGELLDTTELGYDLDGWHLGIVASGPEAEEMLTALARPLDARLLLVRREEGVVWAWFGSRRKLDPAKPEALLAKQLPAGLSLALGEPGEGLSGWRFTYRQARAALSVALRSGETVVRYAGVALLAAALQDELLRTTLRDLYLAPLAAERDGGATLRQTLRAYFAAECNISSTAASMEVDRKTVTSRLRAIEQLLGRPIATCAAELETALRLEQISDSPTAPRATPYGN